MKAIEVLLKILILVLVPTPKNIRELLGMVNGAVANRMDDGTPTYTQAQWDELRRMRNGKKK